MIKEFPVISYKLKDEDPVLFSNTLGESFKDIGFCSISDHPIDTNLINEIIHSFGSFFELSEETKLRYLLKGQGGARGFGGSSTQSPQLLLKLKQQKILTYLI